MAHKLVGMVAALGPAFADFAPGLNPFDWLTWHRGGRGDPADYLPEKQKAQKYRRDEEYGSARWGTEKDIKPFTDPRFENNIILTGTEFLTTNTRPAVPANARNPELLCCRFLRLRQDPVLAHAPSFCRPIPPMWW